MPKKPLAAIDSSHTLGARRGVMLAMVAVCLPLVLLAAAFAVDLTYLRTARNELRLAADAAARSAGRVYAETHDEEAARAAGRAAGELNFVAAKPLLIDDDDIEFGTGEYDEADHEWRFTPGTEPTNAVRVVARKSHSSPSGPIDLFFAKGIAGASIEVTTEAVAVNADPEVMYVLDRSGTMAYPQGVVSELLQVTLALLGFNWCDPVPDDSRWNDADQAIRRSLGRLDRTGHVWIGLVTFADAGATDVPLTRTLDDLRNALTGRSATFCGGNKRADRGIEQALDEFAGASPSSGVAQQRIVLITDGKNLPRATLDAAAEARGRGVAVDVVAFGFEADRSFLSDLATAGGGELFFAEDAAQLEAVFLDVENRFQATAILIGD